MGIAFVAVAILAGFFVDDIFRWLLWPSDLDQLNYLGPAQGLLTDIKLALFTAFLLTLPVLIYQAWMFVAPAVGEVGRATTYILVAMSSSLFLAGVVFGYWLVLPIGLDFLLGYAPDRYNEVITADTYLPFVTRFLLACGRLEWPSPPRGAKLGLLTADFLSVTASSPPRPRLAASLTPVRTRSDDLMRSDVRCTGEHPIARFVPLVPQADHRGLAPLRPLPDDGRRGRGRERTKRGIGTSRTWN